MKAILRFSLVVGLATPLVISPWSEPANAASSRIGGADRYETAALVAERVRSEGLAGSTVLLTTGENFPDAVVAGGWRTNAAVLLVRRSELPPATRTVLTAGWVTEVYAIGGSAVIADSVLDEVRALGLPVTRLAGDDRYGTSLAVSAATNTTGGTASVWIASGTSFTDQLVAAAGARRSGGAMILVRPFSELSAAQLSEISRVTQGRATTINLVDTMVSLRKVNVPGASVQRHSASAYDIALDVQVAGTSVIVASGENWPDALGGTRLVTNDRALLLSKKACAPARASVAIRAASTVLALGGSGALSDSSIGGMACPAASTFDAPFKVTGTGDAYIDYVVPFDAMAGLDVTYSGDHHFSIVSRLEGDEYGDLLVNTIGSYSGRVLLPNAESRFNERVRYLEISASGPWAIIATPVDYLPQFTGGAAGVGDEVLRFMSNANRATFTHDGTRNFIVSAHGLFQYGSTWDLLINVIGPYNGQVRIPSVTRVLEIQADGTWTVAAN